MDQPKPCGPDIRANPIVVIAGFTRWRVWCSVALLSMSAASQIFAQDDGPGAIKEPGDAPLADLDALKELDFDELMQVRVATVSAASKREEKTTSAPGTIIVISQHDIRLRGYSNLVDVLRDLPGFDVSGSFFSELGAQVSVRGIPSNSKIVVLMNGMRVNPPGGEFFPFRSDFSIRTAKQIEIIYGPGSTLYGQDAISAVINIKTQDVPAPGGFDLQGGAEGGLHNEREIWFSFAKSFDTEVPISLSGYFQYHDSDLTDLAGEYPAWYRDFDQLAEPRGGGGVFERRDLGINAFAKLDVGDFYFQTWYRESERSSSEGYGPPTLFYVPQAIWRDHSWVSEVGHSWEINDALTLQSSATYNWYEVDPSSRYVFPQDENSFFFNDFKYADGSSFSIEETLHVKFSPNLTGLFGGTYSTYDILPKATVPGGARPGSHSDIVRQAGAFEYFLTPGDASSRREIPRAVESEFERYGGYGELAWQITPNLKIIGGGRVDQDSRISEPSYTPRAAVIYKLTEELTAKYTYSWAYISPAPYFAFATYDRGDILNTSNPEVQPEESQTHELGLTYNNDVVDVGLSLFYGEQDNLILISDVGSGPNIVEDIVYLDLAGTMPRTLTRTVNSGSSENAGGDFFVRAKLNEKLSTWFSYSYVTFEQTTAGRSTGLQGLSQHNFRYGLTWAILDDLYVTPSLVARSTPANIDAGRLSGELSNPWEINLHLLYAPTEACEIYMGLSNVTDNRNALTGFLPSAIPQETFGGVVGMRIRF